MLLVHRQRNKSLSVCYKNIESKKCTTTEGMCITHIEFKMFDKCVAYFVKRNSLSLKTFMTIVTSSDFTAGTCVVTLGGRKGSVGLQAV